MESLTRSDSRLAPESAGSTRPAAPAVRHLVPCALLALGSYVPARVLTNHDLEGIVETNDEWIVSRTGIRERHIADPDEHTSDLALNAARRALTDAGLAPADLDLILVATVTPDYPFPSTACIVQDRLGARHAAAFDIGAACSGFIYGLSIGAQFIQTGAYRHVLVIGAETLSRITNWRDRTTCVLFGDGAGAAILGPAAEQESFLSFDLGADGGGGEFLQVVPGGWGHALTTGCAEPMTQSIRMVGSEVFKFAVRIIEESSLRALHAAGLTVSDVDLFVPHQANIRIIDASVKRMGLSPDRVFNNVDRYGNTSAASIPIALQEARAAGRIEAGMTILLSGFGAGLAWASCVMRWTGRTV